LTLERKDDGWHVQQRGGYPANVTQIKELLIKMGDLKVVQSDPIGASQLARMHLAEPGKGADSAVLLEFKDAQGKTLQSLLLGKKHTTKNPTGPRRMPFGEEGFADGRYVMLGGDTKTVLTISDALNTSIPSPPSGWTRTFSRSRSRRRFPSSPPTRPIPGSCRARANPPRGCWRT
jgi:hypothetical protein